MKKIVLVISILLFEIAVINSQKAKIKIDIDRKIGEIDKKIYGNFVEHLGRCVYGGIYDPDSPFADEDGLRKDVIEAVRDLGVTIIRYPGGNFVSNYHWLDGVGPERKTRLELAWQRIETNEFGTNEFIKFIRKVNAEPYFSVNMGTGTIEEAQWWVEYCNIKEGPYYAELRKKHGFNEPHNIKFWSLGNEMDGFWQMGQLSAEDYAKKARETAKLMRYTDPSIKLVAAGSSNYYPGSNPDEWNETIIRELRDYIDYIALHIYVGNPDNNYYNFLATPLVMEHRTKITKGIIEKHMQQANRGNRPPIYIAWDEYNVWYRARTDNHMKGTRALEEIYNLEDALVIACFLNGFIRNADIIKMANMAQLVNVIAPIFTEKDKMFKQTIYYPFQLFAKNVSGMSLDVYVDCEKYNTNEFYIGLGESKAKLSDVPYLDVSAAYNNGKIFINVVNRHKDKPITTEIIAQTGEFTGIFNVYEVNGPDIKATNSFDEEKVKTIQKPDVKAKGNVITYTFPPHSFTMLIGNIKK